MGQLDSSSTLYNGSLRNHFLVAMPSLLESEFAYSIAYVCDHNADGAMGLIINKPMSTQLNDVFDQMNIPCKPTHSSPPVLAGGPLEKQRGFVLHTTGGNWESSAQIGENISLTASKDILKSIAVGQGPANPHLVLGHAGWGAGQLEKEIKENSWLTVPASTKILFDTPSEQRWLAASQNLGIDIHLMSTVAGHS